MKTKCYSVVLRLAVLCMSISVASCDLIGDALRGLDDSTVFYYTPITYCNAIFDEEGSGSIDGEPITVQQALVYRIDAIENNTDSNVSLNSSLFNVELDMEHRGFGRIANLLTTFAEPTMVAANDRIESAGLVAKRINNAETAGVVTLDDDPDRCEFVACFRVKFRKLIYAEPGVVGVMRLAIRVR